MQDGVGFERLIPGQTGDEGLLQRHLAAYAFVVGHAGRCGLALDCGCGAGYGTQILDRHCGPTVGLDRDAHALRHARQAYAGPVGHVCGDALRLPFADRAFDVIVTSQVLEHFADPDGLCRELARTCRPAGRAYFVVPNALTQAPGQYGSSDYHEVEFDPAALRAVLDRHFTSVELRGCFAGKVMARHEGASIWARRSVAGDRLGLRRLLPAGARRWLLGVVRGSVAARGAAERADDLLGRYNRDFYQISEGDLAKAIDLVAVCGV